MSSEGHYNQDDVQHNPSFHITGLMVTVALVVTFTVVLFFVCLHFLACCFQQGSAGASQRLGPSTGRRRLAFRGHRDLGRLQRVGLEESVIESLPVFVYQSANHKDRLECAVCLCEFKDNEKARLLPNCNHGFHVDCIDMWFHSHSTCPLCRSTARPDASSTVAVVGEPSGMNSETDERARSCVAVDGGLSEQQRGGEMATQKGETDGPCASNVLSRGTRNQISSRFSSSDLDQGTSSPKASGKIVIDIPRRADGFRSPRLFTEDEQQGYSLGRPSSESPSTRLRSLKLVLSRREDPSTESSWS